jgi:threonine dehydratase
MPLFTLDDLHHAAALVRTVVPPTPQFAWPLLAERTGVEIVLKHENHTPTGAFKVRGGLVYLDGLRRAGGLPPGLVTATRGNHGQSVALAARSFGLPAVVVVPEGNSREKNSAMRAFGAELVIAGRDFDESRGVAASIAAERGYHFVPSFHVDLVRGVATYALELFTAAPDLAAVYVPIGMGSGIAAVITVRDLLGLETEVIGVVAENAPAYALSFEAGHPVRTNSAATFADGLACRDPDGQALAIIRAGAARVLRLSEDAFAEAIRVLYEDTHNLAEGAGAAALAGLLAERERWQGRRVGAILCGGNIDREVFAEVLAGRTPRVGSR